MREVQSDEIGSTEEVRRDGFGEIIVSETESSDRVEETEFRRNVAGEALIGEVELGDSAASANDARPMTRGGIGVRPGIQNAIWVGLNGGFEREE